MTSPRQVVERLLDGIHRGAWSQLPELYAEDAAVERPFAPDAMRHVAGRDEVRKRFADAGAAPLEIRVTDLTVHETADPEVVIAESGYELRATSAGRTSLVRNIQVFRVREGRIVWSRDYHDHAAIAAARD